MNKKLLYGISTLLISLFSTNTFAVLINFSDTNGGFVSSGAPDWNRSSTGWETLGSSSESDNYLTSSTYTVDTNGNVSITLNHAYNFEDPYDFYDGGVFEASINGNAFSIITPNGGYPEAEDNADGCDGLAGQSCWSGDSYGLVTDTLSISGLNSGNSLKIRLHGNWDHSSGTDYVNNANWQVASIEIDNVVAAVPIPATVWLFGSGLIGVVRLRKTSKTSE
jgi:hypothetical protein